VTDDGNISVDEADEESTAKDAQEDDADVESGVESTVDSI